MFASQGYPLQNKKEIMPYSRKLSELAFQRRSLIMTLLSEKPGLTRKQLESVVPRESYTLESDLRYLFDNGYLEKIKNMPKVKFGQTKPYNKFFVKEI